MSFSVVEEDKLIELVSRHSILYDVKHPEYRNSHKKENAWKFIAQELEKSDEACKKTWKFIRDGYQRFKRRNKKGHGWHGTGHRNSKDTRHIKLLFLENMSQMKSESSYLADSSSIVNVEDITKNDGEEPRDFFELEVKNNEKEIPSHRKAKRIQIRCDSNDDKPLKYWKDRDDMRQDSLNTIVKKKDDDVGLFCQHIAEVLRSLPPVYKANAKKDISIIISDYEIKAAEMQGNTE